MTKNLKRILILVCLVWVGFIPSASAGQPSQALQELCYTRMAEATMLKGLGHECRSEMLRNWWIARKMATTQDEQRLWDSKIERETYLVREIEMGKSPEQIQKQCLQEGR